jgi:hypothetical protein
LRPVGEVAQATNPAATPKAINQVRHLLRIKKEALGGVSITQSFFESFGPAELARGQIPKF